jgi:ubiquinone/menaquinone biosynthesis C-methylase UbiE
MENIMKYYENYDEDNRLLKDNAHKIELITTLHFLDKLIKRESKILELGAGTGRYSLYYAETGHDVTALDLVPKHIEIMKEKAKLKKLEMNITQGNALDLNSLSESSFDVVLCLGPLYHLTTEEERNQCIAECLRVLKPGGILAVAYISRFATFVNYIHRNKANINDEGLQNISRQGLEVRKAAECFYHSTCSEVEELMNQFNIVKIEHIGTDGIGGTLRDIINKFDDSEFKLWMDYHLETCRDSSLMGYSQHGLYICRKM